MNTDVKATVKKQRMFELVLDDLNNGQTPTDLATALQEVVQAVRNTGKAGKVTFSIKVKPGIRGDVTKVEIEDEIKVTTPTCDRAKSYFFVTKDCELSRRDPNQPELPMKNLEVIDTIPLREIAN